MRIAISGSHSLGKSTSLFFMVRNPTLPQVVGKSNPYDKPSGPEAGAASFSK